MFDPTVVRAVHHRVVHDAVAKRRRSDDACLALVDGKKMIVAGTIASVLKLALQGEQFVFKIQSELGDGQTAPFAPARFPVRVE